MIPLPKEQIVFNANQLLALIELYIRGDYTNLAEEDGSLPKWLRDADTILAELGLVDSSLVGLTDKGYAFVEKLRRTPLPEQLWGYKQE